MQMNLCRAAFQLHMRHLPLQRQHRSQPMLPRHLQVPGIWHNLHQLRRAQVFVQNKDAILIGQIEAARNLRHAALLSGSLCGLFFVDLRRLLHRRGLLLRRFGSLLWQPFGELHPLLAALGPEPLTDAFDGNTLWRGSRGRSAAVKLFLMDNANVVGVGNIYASEALFAAGIDPRRAAGKVSRQRYASLAAEVKRILAWAIERGGTTLRDFLNPDGAPGYFFRELNVYGRAGEPCKVCGTPIKQAVLGQRSTFWCPCCQK